MNQKLSESHKHKDQYIEWVTFVVKQVLKKALTLAANSTLCTIFISQYDIGIKSDLDLKLPERARQMCRVIELFVIIFIIQQGTLTCVCQC